MLGYEYALTGKQEFFLWLYQVLPNIDVIEEIYKLKVEAELDQARFDRGILPANIIALGPWSNWEHTINNPPFRWGVNPSTESNVGVFRMMRPGDIIFYYANQDKPKKFSKRGLFGVGRVTKTYDENSEQYWPDEKLQGKIIDKHRFEIESIKLVQTDSEILPWIDGLPFTKGLNRSANQNTLKQLIDNTEKISCGIISSFKKRGVIIFFVA